MGRINLPARAEVIRRRKKDRMPIRPKQKTETYFDRLQHFLFETVFYLIVREFRRRRITPQLIASIRYSVAVALPAAPKPSGRRGGWACKNVAVYRVKKLTTVCTALLVPFTVLCATFFAVIAVFFATCRAVRTGPA